MRGTSPKISTILLGIWIMWKQVLLKKWFVAILLQVKNSIYPLYLVSSFQVWKNRNFLINVSETACFNQVLKNKPKTEKNRLKIELFVIRQKENIDKKLLFDLGVSLNVFFTDKYSECIDKYVNDTATPNVRGVYFTGMWKRPNFFHECFFCLVSFDFT